MALADVIATVLKSGAKLRSGTAGNEANTKALLIDPILQALGWDLYDIDAVEREVKVYDGTVLDYALRTGEGAQIYVEAKSVSGDLDDKKFVSQAINYANNDGVVWCVLTNGLRYRVFKTNEVASMDRKLLFEVDLTEKDQALVPKADLLSLISHRSVVDGALDRYGERVFTDARLRTALSSFAAAPSAEFLGEMKKLLGPPAVPESALRRSLARILDAPALLSIAVPASSVTGSPPRPTTSVSTGKYAVEHHLAGKAEAMRELWESVDGFVQTQGADVERRCNKKSIGYYRSKKAICTAQVRNNRVLMHLKLDPHSVAPWNEGYMRDVAAIGHWGNGDFEYSLTATGQLDELRTLLQRAYAEAA